MRETKTRPINWKSLSSTIFIILMLAIMLYLLFRTHSVEELRGLYFRMNSKWLLAALACIFLSYIAEMLCFNVLIRTVNGKTSFRIAYRVTMVGQYFNAITPFAGGGQPLQIFHLMQDGIPMGRCANITMVKSLIFQVSVFLASVLSFVFNSFSLNSMIGQFNMFFIIGVTINLIVITFFGLFILNKTAAENVVNWGFRLLGKLRIIKNPDKFSKQKETELEGYLNGSELILRNTGAIVKATFFQLLNLFFIYVIPWFMLGSLEGFRKTFFDIVTSQAVLRQITAYVPSPGSAGGAEGISYFFFRNFFLTSPIVSVILIWRILTYYLNILFSGLSILFMRSKDVKQGKKNPGIGSLS